MIFRSLLTSAILFLYFSSVCQNFEELSKDLLRKSEISNNTFNQSIDTIQTDPWIKTDTVFQYNNWLITNKNILLTNQSSFFKVHYFIDLAKTNEALENNLLAYQNIDSALSYINAIEFPDAYYTVLMLGKTISNKNADISTSIRYLKETLNSGCIHYDTLEKVEIMFKLSDMLLYMHRYEESMKYCNMAYSIYHKLGTTDKMARLLITMYNNNFHSTADTSNWEYLYRALEIANRTGDSMLIADVYANLGKAHYRAGDHLKAIENYKKARSFVSDKTSYTEVWIAEYQNLSYTLIDSVESACALSAYLLEQALTYNPYILSNAYRGRAWCYAKRGQKDSTIYYLKKAAETRESYEKANASAGFYFYLYDVAIIVDEYELAIKYLRESLKQFRQYSRESNAEILNYTRAQFDYELQKERIKKLKLENQLQEEQNARQQFIIIAIVVFLVIVISFLLIYRKQIKNLRLAYQNLVKKNLELDKTNISFKALEIKKTTTRNGIHIKDEEKIFLKLKALLEDEKIFRRQDLSESKLAELLNTNNSYLSSIINNRFKMHFKTLLNKYRIDEARSLLVSEKYSNYSIEGIANEVGYQSRSAFYSVFKQNTGMTPSAYVKAYSHLDD
ncbi:MAG: helix-turn-helix domain-containing protein [Bacteroidota bacterium]